MKILQNIETGYIPDKEYPVYIKCTNCEQVYLIAIPKGIKVNDYLAKEFCPDCGCRTMVKR